MAIGINWKEIWKAVWKPVWTFEEPEPPAPDATPVAVSDVGPVAAGGGVGTGYEDRWGRNRRQEPVEEASEEPDPAVVEAERVRHAEALAEVVREAQALADASFVEYLRQTPLTEPPPPPSVNFRVKLEARGTVRAKQPTFEAVVKASLAAKGVVVASISPELPLRAQGIARGGATARMHLEVEDDALALILGVPEMPGDLKEYVRIA
jgi:hypothetical protein